ncbi:carbohydrate-binding module family 1 protein [Serendipita vermifera MAFF 305830]|uniref:AA9 family lytic polysaccharide monooxygenase n=1 Tax=Serendipita vermifera MAFF 305830 TaxID=933852 RepID=A0A0C3B4D8_SERVB|nr:carbohydrate-binding module family 1 protein [Serendipita vermifera MAFF 305830]
MRTSIISSLLLVAAANAHTIFQAIFHQIQIPSGKSNTNCSVFQLMGPIKDSRLACGLQPIYNVLEAGIACNVGVSSSSTIINVPAGAKVGAQFQRIIGGGNYPGDPENPIAASHHGPIQVYLAKVSNAASTGTSGLSWFKIFSDGLSGGVWAVDKMYSNGSFTPSSTVSFPGAYSPTDPGIKVSIYGGTGAADNGGKPYYPPGPAVITCSGGSTTNPTTNPPAGGGGTVPLFGQCGGQGYTGGTSCAAGVCKVVNQWYTTTEYMTSYVEKDEQKVRDVDMDKECRQSSVLGEGEK